MSTFTNTALLPVTQVGDRAPTATVKVAHHPDPYRPVVCHETHRCCAYSFSVFTPHSGHAAARGSIAQRSPWRHSPAQFAHTHCYVSWGLFPSPDLSTCAFSAPRPSLRGYWFQERQKARNCGAVLPVPLGVPGPLCSRFSCSAEFTVEVHTITLSVSGLEPQNPTLRRDSFPKKIPTLLTQCWGLRRRGPESAALWQKHHEGTEEGERGVSRTVL